MTMDERQANLTATTDQWLAGMTDVTHAVAGVIGNYNRELLHQGISADDAMKLCLDFQASIWRKILNAEATS